MTNMGTVWFGSYVGVYGEDNENFKNTYLFAQIIVLHQ